MTGKPEVMATLQAALSAERHLNLQYRSDHKSVSKSIGAKKVAKKLKHFADDEHFFYNRIKNRILQLEGSLSGPVADIVEATTLTDTLRNELASETALLLPYEKAIQTAMAAYDDHTRNLFEHLIKWHHDHVEWLELQLRLIDNLTEANYIAEKL